MTLKEQEGYSIRVNDDDWLAEDHVRARWYVVQSQPHREAIAVLELAKQGFRVFSPGHLKTRRHARRIATVRAPFFPGYIFISLNMEYDRWRSVNGTRGVSRIISFGDLPSPVPVGIVEAFLDQCDEDGILRGTGKLKVGQTVKVLAGPFAEFVGTLEHLDDNGRVCVLLEIMGGRIPVRLSRALVGN